MDEIILDKDDINETLNNKRILIKKLLPFLIILASVLFLEGTVFQYRFFHPILTGAVQKTYTAEEFSLTSTKGSQKLVIDDVGTKVTAIELDTDCDYYHLTVAWTDEAAKNNSTTGAKQAMHQYTNRGTEYYLNTRGQCKKLTLTIHTEEPIKIDEVRINAPVYDIRWLRVIIFSIAITAVYLLFKNKPWKNIIAPAALSNATKSNIRIIGMVYILLMFAILTLSPGMESNTEHCSIEKPVYSVPDDKDAYMMQTDAFVKGQAHLDIKPSAELLALENPYDTSSRRGVEYTWDFAFYDGAYYSYFGVVPVILVLLPFRLVTGYYLSSYLFAFLLGAAAAAVLCLVYVEAVRRFIPRLSAFAYHMGLVAVLGCSFLAYLSARSWFYEIPYNSSLLCIFLALYFALRYDRAKGKKLSLILSGLFFGLSVGCRPVALISILLIAPIILYDIGKDYKNSILFIIPAAQVGILLGLWNYIRFDSFFDFGNAYQLTVSDIRYNSMLDLPVVFDGVYRYLFGQIRTSSTFPFVFAKHADLTNQSHLMYSQPLTGLVRYPLYWCVGLVPFVFKKDKRFGAFAACGLGAAAVLLLSVSASGGVCERYTLDFRWIFALVAVLCALKLMSQYGPKRRSYNLLFGAVAVISVAISLGICIMGEFSRLPSESTNVYMVLRDTFELLY